MDAASPQSAASPHYTVLARRFRPQTFSEVVGQSHVAQALKNAIAGGRVAHAYLFTGARGVGKTSMARILAKALNCPNARNAEPCNQCDVCQAIASGHDVDVLEIDGASNRRIDDIRLLRSNVGVKPMRARYKVYIIDEVHMLTNEAFNALLKTLEEPPPNVKFIFCTTEPNKVPETILSRCQRFDFASIATQKIAERLHKIAVAEECEVESAALELVARRAGGSMRDSQSLFDQLLAYGGKSITADDVHRLLGTASDERLIELAEAVVGRQPARVLELLDLALAGGVQLGEFVDQIMEYQRDLMVVAAGSESAALQSVAPSNRPLLKEQAQKWGLPTIVLALQILAETKTRMQRSGMGRALAELALVRLCLLEETLDLASLVEELRSGPGDGGSKASAGQPAARAPSHARSLKTASPAPAATVAGGGADPHASKSAEPTATPEAQVASVPEASPKVELEFAPTHAEAIWAQIASRIDVKDFLGRALTKVSRAAISGPNRLEVFFPSAYHGNKTHCEQPTALGRLEKVAAEVVGKPVQVVCRLEADSPPSPLADKPPESLPTRTVEAKVETSRVDSASINDPYVERARTIFGATIENVTVANHRAAGGATDESEPAQEG
ncbi:MAG TPA: DNA polymerase III subunit gamma/tau [Planctomycetaceae bacterium]|nr:DNA polymerase III subunit gamma/tau [Planctomycetaceae bacterium]